MMRPPPRSTLFPYTTLCRSRAASRATICSWRARALRAQPPLDATGVQNPAGDLLDGALGGIEPRQRVAREQRLRDAQDRKSTRLNSSHLVISYAVFCLKKNK